MASNQVKLREVTIGWGTAATAAGGTPDEKLGDKMKRETVSGVATAVGKSVN